jgi:hypothetical protein
MSLKQLNRLDILRRAERSEITQAAAAKLLGITDRAVRRRIARLAAEGPESLFHGLKGRRSNNRMPEKEERAVGALLRERYPDFGPTFAAEKLREIHGVGRDPRTVRRIQVGLGLFSPRRARPPVAHRAARVPRPSVGDLVQFDGSYHDWFEGRGGLNEACLLLAVDDATGAIMDARFAAHEGVAPVMAFWLGYAGKRGIPRAVYLDRFSTYSMNMKVAAENPDTLTQFERAAREVGMEVVHAMSPQAKGRVERKFGTLQDRLVKEMRLAGISAPEEANAFLARRFIPSFNRKFARPPARQGDQHRRPSAAEIRDVLPFVFCRRESRVITSDFTVPYRTARFQLLPTPRLAMRPKERVDVHELPDGDIHLFVRGKRANWRAAAERPRNAVQGAETFAT